MALFSVIFNLGKTQSELDFVDIDLDSDTPLYLDPYALTTRDDTWSKKCHGLIISFFEEVLVCVKSKNRTKGIRLLSNLSEPEETHLGVSSGGKGRGIGPMQASALFDALSNSEAAKTGVLEDISDFALFIPGVGRDKISDMTTNIIRHALIEYTAAQCNLLDIPTRTVACGFGWSEENLLWEQKYLALPVHDGKPIILVPKYTVRWTLGVDHTKFRKNFVLEFLREEHLRADDALVTTLKDKKGKIRKTVLKKTVDEHYPSDKDFLARFASEHKDVIENYRESLRLSSSKIPHVGPNSVTAIGLALHLAEHLKSIRPGLSDASKYHKAIIGIVSFLFFPNLIYPKKEKDINEGRKRIDILYTNGKESGLFFRIALDPDVKANLISVECKNYSTQIANPEFDQLIARFDKNRGSFGFLVYRASENQDTVILRCRDAAKSGQGIIMPIDDNFLIKCLNNVANGQRHKIDIDLDHLYVTVCS